MKLGEHVKGSAGDIEDYVVVATSGIFSLAVKPLLSYDPKQGIFGVGVRFRAMAEGAAAADPTCHGVVWDKIDFKVLKPTHASAALMVGSLPVKALQGKDTTKSVTDHFGKLGVYASLAKVVTQHIGTPDEVKLHGEEEVAKGLQEVMFKRMKWVEDQSNNPTEEASPQPETAESDWKEVEDWAANLTKKGGGNTVH